MFAAEKSVARSSERMTQLEVETAVQRRARSFRPSDCVIHRLSEIACVLAAGGRSQQSSAWYFSTSRAACVYFGAGRGRVECRRDQAADPSGPETRIARRGRAGQESSVDPLLLRPQRVRFSPVQGSLARAVDL